MPPAVSIGDGRSLSLARSPLPRAPVAYTVLAAAGAVASATAAALTLSGSSGNYAALQAVARALMVGVPVAVGLYAVRHPASARFGALLILAGFGWFVTTLSESPDPWLYSIGRVAGWAVELSIAYLILAFPTGRISTRVDRVLIALATAGLVGLYLPTALLVERYPLPSPWTGCEHACPANALMVAGSEPALIEDVVRPLRELLTIALFVGVSARLAWRMHRATTLGRRALGPVLAVSIFRLAVLAMLLASRRIAPDGVVPQVMSWLSALALPLLALAFLVGVWH